MPRKGAGVPVTPYRFCCGCIVFLATVLVFQVCILVSLLGKLAEFHKLTPVAPSGLAQPDVPIQVQQTIGNLGTGPQIAPVVLQRPVGVTQQQEQQQLQQQQPVQQAAVASPPRAISHGISAGSCLTLAMAVGLGANEILLFLATLLAATTQRVVLFVDRAISMDVLQEEGLDISRVEFEQVLVPMLDATWAQADVGNLDAHVFLSYLDRTGVVSRVGALQLARARGVAFQADPCPWLSTVDQSAVHVFAEEAQETVEKNPRMRTLLRELLGPEATQFVRQTVISASFFAGSASAVYRHLERIRTALISNSLAAKPSALESLHNVLVRGATLRGLQASAPQVIVHQSRQGPVWSGTHIQRTSVALDSQRRIVDAAGRQFAVLLGYDSHEDIWQSLSERFLQKRRQQQMAQFDCGSYTITPGDVSGFDLSHTPADSQKECCAACSGDAQCIAFIFSGSRRHCWLKTRGATRNEARPGDDVVVGFRRGGAIL